MRKALTLLAVGGWLLFGGTVGAQEQTLDFQAVVHSTEAHALAVPGQPDHRVGVAAFRGLAIFPGGRIANHSYYGSFDFIKGSGQIRGYALWSFEDGSRIEASYAGEAKAAPNGGVTFSAKYSNVTGTGRYAGFQGDGTWAGQRVDYLNQGGDTYFRGSLKLTSAAK